MTLPEPPPLPHSESSVPDPLEAAPFRSPPSHLTTGLWFGGALLWVTAITLVLEHGNRLPPTMALVAWITTAATVGRSIARAGVAATEQGVHWTRITIITGIGFALLVSIAVAMGILLPGSTPRDAYLLLGMLGMATFFTARQIARRALPDSEPSGDADMKRALGLVAVALVSLLLLLAGPG